MPVVELAVDSKGSIKGLNDYDNAVDKSADNSEKGFSKIRTSAAGLATALGTGLVVAATAAAGAMVAFTTAMASAGEKARELENLARVAKTGVEEFQNFAYATKQYGVEADKLADISKDLQDKLGDFIATGGGEFADFFENVAPKVGLTAEALAKLSGPEALVAVKNALDAANISSAEQVFYLESLANDATLLAPLLANNGELLYKNAEQAKALGIALSQIQVDNLQRGLVAVEKVTSMVVSLKDKVLANLAPAFESLTNLVIGYFMETGQSIDSLAATIAGKLLDSITAVIKVVQFLHNGLNGVRLVLQGALVIFAEVGRAGVAAFNLIGEALVAAGLKEENPFANIMESADLFSKAMKENFKEQVKEIVETNQQYENMMKAVEKVAAESKKGFGESGVKGDLKEVKVEAAATTEAIEETVEAVEKVWEVTADTSKATDGMKEVDGEWVNLASSVVNVVTKVEGKAIPAEVKLEEAVKKVTTAAKASTQALKSQADATDEVAAATSRLDKANSDGGGYDAGGSGAGGSFSGTTSAHGNSLSNEEWQSIPSYIQDFLGSSVAQGSSSYDYFNSGSGNRFSGEQGFTQDWAALVAGAAAGKSGTTINNNFNQSISRSDVVGIIEEQNRVAERT